MWSASQKHRQAATIFVTHGHADHFFGAGPVLDAFPDARLTAGDQQVVDEARGQTTTPEVMASWNTRFAGTALRVASRPLLWPARRSSTWKAIRSCSARSACGRRTRHDRARARHAGHLFRRHRLQQHPHVAMELHAGVPAGVAGFLDTVAALKPSTIITGHKDPGAPDDNATACWTSRAATSRTSTRRSPRPALRVS